jgi:hypothetical protein
LHGGKVFSGFKQWRSGRDQWGATAANAEFDIIFMEDLAAKYPLQVLPPAKNFRVQTLAIAGKMIFRAQRDEVTQGGCS